MIKYSYIQHIKNHKDSQGNNAPWVIKSHDDDHIISSHKTKEEAESHLKDIYIHKNAFIGINSLDDLIKQSTNKKQIMIDLDGVLVDFDQGFKNITGYLPEEFENMYSTKEFWKIIETTKDYWYDLEMMPNAKILWDYVKKFNPIVLTTPGGGLEQCKKQKKEWVKKYLGNVPVKFSFHKEEYADLNTILIDDKEDNIKKWKDSGGIGILFKNNEQTIKELSEVL